MLEATENDSRPLAHDAETFCVAEELIMLSTHAAPSPLETQLLVTDSPSNISGIFEHTAGAVALQKVKAKAQRSHRTAASKVKKRSIRAAAQKSTRHDDTKQEPREGSSVRSQEDIINSRCDLSQSELLQEHRTHFRRVRRRWNIEQRNRNREYLARFNVQGIPLMQHLETTTTEQCESILQLWTR